MQQASVCTSCGRQNPPGQQFCGGCGARLFSGGQQQPYGAQQVYSCPRCGQSITHGVTFCGSCGTPLNWPGQQQMQAPPLSQQQPQGLSQQAHGGGKAAKTKGDLVASNHTILPCEDVIVRAVQFFTNEKWALQTQSARIATFVGTPRVSAGGIILYLVLIFGGVLLCFTFIGAFLGVPMIIAGIVLGIRTGLRMRGISGRQNLVVTANPLAQGTEVVITYPNRAKNTVSRFLSLLPTA